MAEKSDESEDFIKTLENGVRAVLSNRRASPGERMAAVQAGVKILAIRHRIFGEIEKGFFDR